MNTNRMKTVIKSGIAISANTITDLIMDPVWNINTPNVRSVKKSNAMCTGISFLLYLTRLAITNICAACAGRGVDLLWFFTMNIAIEAMEYISIHKDHNMSIKKSIKVVTA